MGEPLKLVQPKVNQHVIDCLEEMLEEARRGDLQAFIAFRIGELPRTIGHVVAGGPRETDVIFAIERWKVNHLTERDA